MRNVASAALVAVSAFACSSTDAIRPSPAVDAGRQDGGGKGTVACDESGCEGRTYMGQVLGTCCVSARGCGVVLDGKCVATNVLRAFEPDAGRLPPLFGTPETVVLDPTCPDQMFSMGGDVLLKGCCDKSGLCGSSTEAIGASFGISIAAMCVTRAESTRFGQSATADAGPEKRCSYPAEAGAPPEAGTHD